LLSYKHFENNIVFNILRLVTVNFN